MPSINLINRKILGNTKNWTRVARCKARMVSVLLCSPPNIHKIVSHQSETFYSDLWLRTNTVFDAGSEKRPELWFRLNRFTSIFFLSWEMKSVMKSLATSSITRCKNYWKQALWTVWLLDRQDRISGKVPLLENLQVINIVCSLSTWVEAISHTKIILLQGIEY